MGGSYDTHGWAGPLKYVKVAFFGQDRGWAQTTPALPPPLQPLGTLKAQVLSWGGIPGFQQAHSRHYSTLYGLGVLPCSPTSSH